ncbi:coiled-coil domain-containing protein 167-like [Acropora muricata]|uniref:coiled-coil domain-containing protein 167-like n=1 Tax=Acropora muricata TaxID=159855 RepID=UPI0034E58C06
MIYRYQSPSRDTNCRFFVAWLKYSSITTFTSLQLPEEKMPTIVSQIEDLENKIKASEDQIDKIDRSLRLRNLSDVERNDLENEMKHLKEKIEQQEKDLGALRKENRKSMAVSVAIFALLSLGYLLFNSL